MVHIERNVEIKAPVNKVFDILDEPEKFSIWNITVNDVEILEPKKKGFVKSTVGNFTSTRYETVKNEKIFYNIEDGVFDKMGYSVKPKGEGTEATLWAEFKDESKEKMLLKAGEILLNSLKKYAEFLEGGGNPADYKKK
jgi:uncharacterized protein YndB with AHSA1/START domain